MGAFFLYKKESLKSLDEVKKEFKPSLEVFDKKQLKLSKVIDNDDLSLFIYHKHSSEVENYLIDDENNFIVSTGTCFYKKESGSNALKNLLSDFDGTNDLFDDLYGNYCTIIYKNKQLFIFNDYLGLYRVYVNKSQNTFSSSFVSLAKSNEEKSVSKQELYEYIFYGAFYADKTVFEEIDLISSKYIFHFDKEFKIFKEKKVSHKKNNATNPEELFNIAYDSNLEYFKMLKDQFGDSITSALSGGFDTRTMLAISKRVGINLKLYVYGGDSSTDVKIAKHISGKEGFDLNHENRSLYQKVEKSNYPQTLDKNFYLLDGFGISGIFDNGSDVDTRIKRVKNTRLHINGGGGEVYRNFWELPNRRISIRNFLGSKYKNGYSSISTKEFNKKAFYKAFEEKIKKILSVNRNTLKRVEVEKLYPFMRLKYWMGINNSINNQFSYSVTPFAEPEMFYTSLRLPLRSKNLGRFQAGLISKMDVNISKYMSDHGFNFNEKKIKWKLRLKEFLRVNSPSFVRRFVRRRKKGSGVMPYYLNEEYLTEIFGSKKLQISDYVDLNKVNDQVILSRALTLEYLFTKVENLNPEIK